MARSGQGRAVCARGSEPLTARTVLEHVTGGAFHSEAVGVSHWLFAPLRFDRPLGDQELRGAAGFLPEAHGDQHHLVEAGFNSFHKSDQ